ncbi:MAG: hypothetical protein FWD23_11990 [Oscillospiraceae bacterium]|nr:hypothetical protein [Oscillospiraceae bacterium]
MKKALTAIFLTIILVLAAALFSCSDNDSGTGSGNNDDGGGITDANDPGADIDENIARDPEYSYGGERFDFKGETFTVAFFDMWSGPEVEEQTGDPVDDAAYKRRIAAEEFFNIEIKQHGVGPDMSDLPKAVINDVLAGINSYDIVLPHKLNVATMVTQGVMYNWDEMPNVDFSKKYWNQSILGYVDIKGYIPYVSNDYCISSPSMVYFNKNLVSEYQLDSPYDFVKAGTWTIEKMAEMAKQVSRDLDGDGVFTENDQYGFASIVNWPFITAMYACDVTVGQWQDGRYVINRDITRVQDMVDKYYDLLYDGNHFFGWDYYQHVDRGGEVLRFDSGRVLFHLMADIEALRAVDFNFGLLPYPKLNEAQEKYIALNWAQVIGAPINIKNPEKVGAVTEYLGAKGNELVLPAHYDILLKGKVFRDDESEEILDLLFDNMIYDFGFDFGGVNELNYLLPYMLEQKNTNVASWFDRYGDMIQSMYDDIVEAAMDNINW